MATRPLVKVYDLTNGAPVENKQIEIPHVFNAPIRRDVVVFVHNNMSKNNRQAYAVNKDAGHQVAAESWGTGRAVSRIPRVPGGGTHRSGQGAFGNMCRGGRMFAPTKIWRRWHRKINKNQRRYAVASALAASAVPALVMARGHDIEEVPEIPLVVSNFGDINKTRDALSALERLNVADDVEKVKLSRKIRGGKGKMRNRRYVQRRGPLIVYGPEEKSIEPAFRNLPGVELTSVDALSVLDLAPGGHLGRFCVWTEAAFRRLNDLFGDGTAAAALKRGFVLPRGEMQNADLASVINRTEIQSVLRPVRRTSRTVRKANPLRNGRVMNKLNPYEKVRKQQAREESEKPTKKTVNKADRREKKKASKALFEWLNSEAGEEIFEEERFEEEEESEEED